MNTSTNEETVNVGGAFADGLTLVRFALTPVIMFVIIKMGWPARDIAILASILFAVAAVTDILDDKVGGGAGSKGRSFGWFDDIADTFLITGTLGALFWVHKTTGTLTWYFAVPALIIILRDVMVGLVKGGDFKKTGWPETRFGTLKTAISMIAVCMLVAVPWLSNWASQFYPPLEAASMNFQAPWVEYMALGFLWIAALLSMATGSVLLFGKSGAANDS